MNDDDDDKAFVKISNVKNKKLFDTFGGWKWIGEDEDGNEKCK